MRTSALGIAVAALLLVAGCGDDDESGSDATEESTTTTTTADCEADDLDATELEEVTVTDGVPAGFELQPDDVGDTGPSDLEKAISDDGGEGAEEALAEFRRGYQWLWVGEVPPGDQRGPQLISFVYEFCDEAGAMGYLERGAEQTFTEATDVTEFDVAEVDVESAETGIGDGYRYAYVDIVDGPFYVRAMGFVNPESDPADVQADTGALAVAQLEALEELSA